MKMLVKVLEELDKRFGVAFVFLDILSEGLPFSNIRDCEKSNCGKNWNSLLAVKVCHNFL